LKELSDLDINEISPLEALNILFNWKKQYLKDIDGEVDDE
jgi:hypothetical protein